MTNKTKNPFDGLASGYQKSRPDYPNALLGYLRDFLPEPQPANANQAADIGAGTGISTRAIQRALGETWKITGIEPGDDMRRQAIELETPGITYVAGNAEHLPIDTNALGLVTVGQAIQFFDRPTFYNEADRVLNAQGVLAIFQNERQWQQSQLLDEYESFVEEHDPGYQRDYRNIDILGELQTLPWTTTNQQFDETWSLPMTAERFIAMTLSRRTMRPVREKLGEDGVHDAMKSLVNRHQDAAGNIVVPYVTELYIATR